MSAVVAAAVLVAWSAIAVAVLFWGTDFFLRLLGQEQCLPPGSIGPCLFLSAVASVLLAWWFRGWGPVSMIVLFVPVFAAALWSIQLRLSEWTPRKKEFGWINGRLVRCEDGAYLSPSYLKT